MAVDVHAFANPDEAMGAAQDAVRAIVARLDRASNATLPERRDGKGLLGQSGPGERGWNWTEAEMAARFANRLEALLAEHRIPF